MQKALITGASSGIGLELANLMASRGHDLVLNSRSKKELSEIAKTLEEQYGVSVDIYPADLSTPGSAQKLYENLKTDNVEILVNNAGFGYVGDFLEGNLETYQNMMHLNMQSLTELCYLFGNDFKKLGGGRILNVASVAAFLPGPRQPIYYATKAYVRSLSRALAYSLKDRNITVTDLHPGPTKTAFFREANAPNHTKGADPKDVAKLGYSAMMSGKTEVTHGLANKFVANVLVRVLPYRLQTLLVAKTTDV